MRIVYCINSIGSGGVEQITIFKANALANIPGNQVWLIYTDLPLSGGYHHPSEKVTLIDLEIRYRENHFKFPWNIIKYYRLEGRHKKALSTALSSIQPDVVISTGQKESRLLPSIKGRWVRLREVHLSKGWRVMRAKTHRDRIIAKLLDYREFSGLLRRYDRIIIPTEYEKKTAWNNEKRVVVIPNPCRFNRNTVSALNQNKLLAVGRFDEGKNYSSLIRSFRLISDRFPDWTLTIVGEGDDFSSIKSLTLSLNLSDKVFFPGYISDLEKYLSDASIFVHTSLFETFGMVIVEAMSYGLPIVAYDCPYGPRSIIKDEMEGYLVPMGNEVLLADRICSIIEKRALRQRMGNLAWEKTKCYDIDTITNRWMDLFINLVGSNKK